VRPAAMIPRQYYPREELERVHRRLDEQRPEDGGVSGVAAGDVAAVGVRAGRDARRRRSRRRGREEAEARRRASGRRCASVRTPHPAFGHLLPAAAGEKENGSCFVASDFDLAVAVDVGLAVASAASFHATIAPTNAAPSTFVNTTPTSAMAARASQSARIAARTTVSRKRSIGSAFAGDVVVEEDEAEGGGVERGQGAGAVVKPQTAVLPASSSSGAVAIVPNQSSQSLPSIVRRRRAARAVG